MSDILKAFIDQSYGSIEKAKEADRQAKLREKAEKELAKELMAKYVPQLYSNQSLAKAICAPTQLKEGELNSKTEAHPNFKNYDHSLEVCRSSKLGLIKLKEEETGGVEEAFANIQKEFAKD